MASDLNSCNFIGRLGKDVETRYMPSGEAVASFSLAVGSTWKDKQGAKQESTEWVNVTAFGKLAEICSQYLVKGSQVYLSGRMKTDKYTDKNGVEKYRTTAAYCRMLGLDATPYETPLSPAEVEIAEHMQRHGISRKAASMLIACSNMPARTVAMGPRRPAFHAVVEYAQTPEQLAESTRLFGEALGEYYAACRRRTISPVFTGD